jgi:two-component system OmpR family sensor kinase
MSIRTRVTLYGIGIVAVVLGVISALFLLLVIGSVPQNQDKELAARADAAARSIEAAPAPDLTPRAPLGATDVTVGTEIIVLVLDDNGAVLSTTGVVAGQPPSVPADLVARARANGGAVATVPAGGVSLRMHAQRWYRVDLGRGGFAVAAQTTGRLQTDRQGAVALLVITGLGALVAASVGIWLVAGRALRPLRQLTAMADEIGRAQDLSRRLLPARRRDDVGRLTEGFNAMMDRLQDAYLRLASTLAAQRRFTADASHELRTPLTTMRSSAGFLRSHPDAAAEDRAAALADIEAEGARMSRLVDDLLTLARADAGDQLRRDAVDLGKLAEEVCRQASRQHPNRKLHCAGAPVQVLGDADALRRLLWILVDNAVTHAPEGGNVWVAVTRHPGGVLLQVADDGPGIPPELLERIFDRFFRADSSRRRGGAGLGLSIARWIVTAHGGQITASNNDRGGATFMATLPAPSSRA